MRYQSLIIGDLLVKYPLVLGAMGIGVTRANLAAAVTNAGGLGVLSGVNLGYLEADFLTNTLEANLRGLKKEIQKAKALSNNGPIGVNFMVAMNAYAEHVKTAVQEGIDFIVSGAGIPVDLPAFVKGSKTKIAPIVSSKKAAILISKLWDRNHAIAPDAIVLEGPKAGGHLGFDATELRNDEPFDFKEIITSIKQGLIPFEEKYNKKIPLIVAGGIFSKTDVSDMLTHGADAVQMSTRFVATNECDAHTIFKESYVKATEDDVRIIISPVGMPGRALYSPLIQELDDGIRPQIKQCVNCLKTCQPKTTPYCISSALIQAVTGNWEKGLFFAGKNVSLVTEITSVQRIFDDIFCDF